MEFRYGRLRFRPLDNGGSVVTVYDGSAENAPVVAEEILDASATSLVTQTIVAAKTAAKAPRKRKKSKKKVTKKTK